MTAFMEYLFAIFIFPLTVLMEFILENFIKWTGSHFMSLVLLSFSVTIIAMPFSIIAERLQADERSVQKKMQTKINEFKGVFKGSVLNRYITTLYRQNRYHPILAVRSSLGFLIQIPFFFAAYVFISDYNQLNGVSTLIFENLGEPDGLIQIEGFTINIMPFVMTAANLGYAVIYGKGLSFKEKINSYVISALFLVLLYNSSSALLIYWTFNNIFGILKTVLFKYAGKIKIPLLNSGKISNEYNSLFFISLLSLAYLTCLAVPFILLASGSESDIEGTFSQILSFQLMLFTVFTVIFSTFFYYFSVPVKKISAILMTVISLYAFANVFLFPGDYGDITNLVFEDGIQISLADTLPSLAVLVLISVATMILIYLKKNRSLNMILSFLFLSLFIFSIHEGIIFYEKTGSKDLSIVSELEKKFVFSTNRKNVVVILLDRFIGGYIPELTELIPELNNEILDGFVWHPRSLSSGSDTLSSEPSIMGGWDYHAEVMNTSRLDVPLLDRMNESIRVLPYNFTRAGFDSSIYGYLSSWMKTDDKTHLENTTVENLTGKYLDIWLKEKELDAERSDFIEKLAVFGLFRVAPPFLRNVIYDDGQWNLERSGSDLIETKKTKAKKEKISFDEPGYVSWKETNSSLISGYLKNYSTLDYLTELSDASETEKGRFYYFSTKLTHEPWLTGSDFSISNDRLLKYPRELYKKYNKSMNALKHIYTDGAALKLVGEWFNWMKENGVYDNTRIIIVSDHGRNIFNPMFSSQKINGSRTTPATWHNTVLVKDFNSRGEMTRNESFITTCDIPYIVLKDIVEGENPYTGNRITEKKDKIPFTVMKTKFRIREQGKFKFTFTELFTVHDEDIFNLSNWEKIDNL